MGSISSTEVAIRRDRDAFLHAVGLIVDARELEAYGRIIHGLIHWSWGKEGVIELRPRDGTQDIVRYCLAGTPHVFWSAYPRPTEADAKLMAVQDECKEVPTRVRDQVRERFIELSRFAPEKSQSIPTISFRVLKHQASFEHVIRCLEDALAAIQVARG